MINTLINPALEAEYIASQYLKGNLSPPLVAELRENFSNIPLVSVDNDFNGLLTKLHKLITNSFGLLDDSVMVSYINGKEKELYEIMVELNDRSAILLPILQEKTQQTEMAEVAAVEIATESATDLQDLSNKLNYLMRQHQNLYHTREMMLDLLKLNDRAKQICELYGTHPGKFPKQRDIEDHSNDYYIYLTQLEMNLDSVVTEPLVAMKLGSCLGAIGSTKPVDDLDEYRQEVFYNILDVLAHPKDYYKDCQLDKIVSGDVGVVFQQCYPEFYEKFLSMYLEDYPTMDFQEQINFRKCFAIPADDSSLLALTNTYIKMSYTT